MLLFQSGESGSSGMEILEALRYHADLFANWLPLKRSLEVSSPKKEHVTDMVDQVRIGLGSGVRICGKVFSVVWNHCLTVVVEDAAWAEWVGLLLFKPINWPSEFPSIPMKFEVKIYIRTTLINMCCQTGKLDDLRACLTHLRPEIGVLHLSVKEDDEDAAGASDFKQDLLNLCRITLIAEVTDEDIEEVVKLKDGMLDMQSDQRSCFLKVG